MGKRSRQDSLSSAEAPQSPASREQSMEVKIVHLEADSAVPDRRAVMKCSLPPHGLLTFASFDEYEVHYHKTHLNRCSECHKNFPDEHFLHLHIAENHDPINAAKKEQGEKTFACLVSSCDRFCSTPFKRRLHCIDKHGFPRNYDFFIVNDGIDRRNSMLRPLPRRRSSTVNATASATSRKGGGTNAATDDSMDIVQDDVHSEEGEDDDDERADECKRAPVKLRGRGGFGHPRTGRGRGRGRGHGRSRGGSLDQTATDALTDKADPMEELTSTMSALQFVPHSIYARAKGRGRGGV